jgi:hypothetical protein
VKRILTWALVTTVLATTPTVAQTFSGPSSPALARIYFYRAVETNQPTPWTQVFVNGQKVGALGERTYFFRDVQPGTYKITVSTDLPYQDQTLTVAPNTTAFVRVFVVPEYGVQVSQTAPGFAPQIYQPSVFGNRVMDPGKAQREMAGLAPAS